MAVIKSFSDRGTYEFWDTGKSKGMPPANLRKAARKKLGILHAATAFEDLRIPPGKRLEAWVGERRGQHPRPDKRPVSRLLRVAGWRRLQGRNNRLPLRQEKDVSFKNNGPAGWAVHPGEILREEFLEPMNISPYRLALDLGVSPPTVNDIVRERRGITPEIAIRLAKYFGNSEQFWLNLQDAFAVYHARNKYSKEPRPSRLWRRAPRPDEGRARTDAPAAKM